MLPVGSVLVDFDGTACLHDVAEHLLVESGDPTWPDLDAAWERGEIGARECLVAQAKLLDAPLEQLVDFALEHCPIDPTFPPFVRWLEGEGVPVTIVSDGFGFYIEPILRSAGLEAVRIVTNTWVGRNRDAPLRFEDDHEECTFCGTCKVRAVVAARDLGRVVFVGEGSSDRFGALFADVVFAKDRLVRIASADGVPFIPWETFDDVRARLQEIAEIPGPVGRERCPGWRTP